MSINKPFVKEKVTVESAAVTKAKAIPSLMNNALTPDKAREEFEKNYTQLPFFAKARVVVKEKKDPKNPGAMKTTTQLVVWTPEYDSWIRISKAIGGSMFERGKNFYLQIEHAQYCFYDKELPREYFETRSNFFVRDDKRLIGYKNSLSVDEMKLLIENHPKAFPVQGIMHDKVKAKDKDGVECMRNRMILIVNDYIRFKMIWVVKSFLMNLRNDPWNFGIIHVATYKELKAEEMKLRAEELKDKAARRRIAEEEKLNLAQERKNDFGRQLKSMKMLGVSEPMDQEEAVKKAVEKRRKLIFFKEFGCFSVVSNKKFAQINNELHKHPFFSSKKMLPGFKLELPEEASMKSVTIHQL